MSGEMPSLFQSKEESQLRRLDWEPLAERAGACTRCRLHEGRTHVVFGEGDPHSPAVFIGEGPGEQEDLSGRPFVGRAGQLLDKILAAAGIPRGSVYITNMVKCRPPGNRNPQPEEMQACWPFLEQQLRLMQPRVIVSLGNVPTQFFLNTREGITKTRGRFYPWKAGIEVFPMFHPSFLLRNPSREPGSPKHLTWQDIQTLKARLEAP